MAGARAARTIHRCQVCGHEEGRWHGRCAGCGEWNSLVEEVAARGPVRGQGAAAPGAAGHAAPVSVSEAEELPVSARLATGLGELDRVLGGGLVPGSLVLLGGEPGIGKSTLLSQML